nr:MAG TPA: hypothetical protein [Caudoviricetes sp.]
MDAKLDAYEGFDPTLIEGGGCSCEGGVYWDMITQTWKQGKVATPKPSADCSQVEAALKQAKADKAKADEKAAKAEEAKTAAEEKATEAAKALDAAKEAEAKATADKEAAETEAESARALAANANVAKDQAERDKEAAQASEATAIAKAEKAKEDLNEALAELVTKQNELTAKDAEIAELKRKLDECQKDKCPEVDVVSLGDETVFSGNSCDKVVGLDGDVPA